MEEPPGARPKAAVCWAVGVKESALVRRVVRRIVLSIVRDWGFGKGVYLLLGVGRGAKRRVGWLAIV